MRSRGRQAESGNPEGPQAQSQQAPTETEEVTARKKPRLGTGRRFKQVAKAAGGGEKGRRIAAAIGRKKYGAKRMAKMAAAGRRRKAR